MLIPIDKIYVNKANILHRDKLNNEPLKEDIKENGLINPIIVTKSENEGKIIYKLFAGFRRLECCKELGYQDIEAHVVE